MRNLAILTFAVFLMPLAGCAAVTAVGVHFLYKRAELPAAQVVRDVAYADGADGASAARQLDLYLPKGRDWPVIVFIHGGGWNSGDKQLKAGGADVYANVGRFYASRGIGVAVINYRLQPTTDWRGQIADARQAVRWVHRHIAERGGRPDEIFLMGHSAGAYLSAFVALDASAGDAMPIRGVISASGAGLDLTDEKTYELGEDLHYYEKRFKGGDATDAWEAAASPVTYATTSAPPFLILYAGGEKKGLQRQAQRLKQVLDAKGVEAKLVVVPGESHSRMVLVLSRDDKTAGPAILEFVRGHAGGR